MTEKPNFNYRLVLDVRDDAAMDAAHQLLADLWAAGGVKFVDDDALDEQQQEAPTLWRPKTPIHVTELSGLDALLVRRTERRTDGSLSMVDLGCMVFRCDRDGMVEVVETRDGPEDDLPELWDVVDDVVGRKLDLEWSGEGR